MPGLGTLINAALIAFGGICGLLLGKWISAHMRDTLISGMGVAVILLAVGGVMENMLKLDGTKLSAGNTLLLIISIALGGIIGEICHIEAGINRFGEWLKKKTGNSGDGSFVDVFVSASCTVCIGAMAIVGSIEDGVSGSIDILLAKGIIDAVFIAMMTVAKGKGCIFSVIPVLFLQGSITLIAYFAGGFLPADALSAISFVGSALIFCVGLNLLREKQISVANLLPSIVIAALIGTYFGI